MALYQGDSEALASLETDAYWEAVKNRQTWDPAKGRYTYDDVCCTIIFTLKDEETCTDSYCTCFPWPGYVVERVRWTKLDEETWLMCGYVPRREASLRRHQTYMRARSGNRNNMIRETI